ncbi:hypothetical protein CJP16_09855 [Aeromonas sobria]|uniref:Uncharacterized protein n=1 Tax=Aeromonas sobria TaxID=646 RepID=A0A2N3J073_AERSO|nr:hypothetical protein CJP16_09855 [Aeromonas sobria]
MNLWLTPHGIWYYRKVTTLPCGRRKEIKKSLHTRDKLDCQQAEHGWIHFSSMSWKHCLYVTFLLTRSRYPAFLLDRLISSTCC